jgi:hypothetical protein
MANGSTSKAQHVSQLPFNKLSQRARHVDTFTNFPTSLMSVGKTSDDGTVSVLNKSGITVHREEDILITCKGEPILIGVHNVPGQYCIPLTQHQGHWQPWRPSKQAQKVLRQANSVYNLPSTEQAIKWTSEIDSKVILMGHEIMKLL